MNIAQSIFGGSVSNRFEAAEDLELFTAKELRSFGHLNEIHPKPEEAAEYIDALIGKLEYLI